MLSQHLISKIWSFPNPNQVCFFLPYHTISTVLLPHEIEKKHKKMKVSAWRHLHFQHVCGLMLETETQWVSQCTIKKDRATCISCWRITNKKTGCDGPDCYTWTIWSVIGRRMTSEGDHSQFSLPSADHVRLPGDEENLFDARKAYIGMLPHPPILLCSVSSRLKPSARCAMRNRFHPTWVSVTADGVFVRPAGPVTRHPSFWNVVIYDGSDRCRIGANTQCSGCFCSLFRKSQVTSDRCQDHVYVPHLADPYK